MGLYLSRQYFDSICQYLFTGSNKISAGLDRVTADNFINHAADNYDIIQRKISNCTYHFTNFKKVDIGKRIICIPTCRDRVVLEYLKMILKNNYSISMKSRNDISNDLALILNEEVDYYIVRLDIKHFFDSIDHGLLLSKIKKDSLLSVEEFSLLSNLLKRYGDSGVPQGVAVSNYLAEIFLRSFDLEVKKILPRTFYYQRYVDDIILIIPGIPNDIEKGSIKVSIEKIFDNYNLLINEEKCQSLVFDKKANAGIDYLGYNYRKENGVLVISISDNKMSNLKAKVDYMMRDYIGNGCFALLLERLKNLTMIHDVGKVKHYLNKDNSVGYKKVKCTYGTKYDYRLAGDEDFIILNNYIISWIHRLALSRKQKRYLYGVLYPTNGEKAKYYNPYNKKISQYRSLIYEMSDRGRIGTGWLTLLYMDKKSMSKEYQRLVKGIT